MNYIRLAVNTTIMSLIFASSAWAHSGLLMTGLTSGLAHPILGLDHLLAMCAVGMWSALMFLNKKPLYPFAGPFLLLSMLALGFLVGNMSGIMPFIELGIVGSVILLGLMIATVRYLPIVLGFVAIAGFAFVHGHAHGSEAVGSLTGYMIGFISTSAALNLLGYQLGHFMHRFKYGVPLAASAITFAGITLIWV